AVPVKVIAWSGRNFEAFCGEVTVTTGGASFSTGVVGWAGPVGLVGAAARAGITGTPRGQGLGGDVPPGPPWACRLEVHLRAVVMTPSVALVAVPVKLTALPVFTLSPSAGAAMVTTGRGLGR